MDNNDIDLEKGMNSVYHNNNSNNLNNSINMTERTKPKGILVNNHRESYENWFVDTIIRSGLFIFGMGVLVPLIVLAFYYSNKNYDCATHLMSINTIFLCCGVKTTILFIIYSVRLYNESSLTNVSERTINFFKKFSKVHFFYEIVYNSFIIYLIYGIRLSNCNIVPLSYLIIYLVLNFFGMFLYWLSSFYK